MLNWAIIGSGDVVNRLVKKSFHIPKKSFVKYIFSKDLFQAKKISKKYKLGKVVNNINVIIKDKDVNCVYIATPPDSHFDYIKKFARAKKNILCEKPLIINLKHINLVRKICKKNKVSLTTLFYRRYLKRFIYIKKILKSKKIGKIIFFRVTLTHSPDTHPAAPINTNKIKKKDIPWRFNKYKSGGGNFLDMGSHAIDLINFLLGDIKNIDSLKKNYMNYYNVEDTLISNVELYNGIVGQGAWSSVVEKNIDSFEIFGTRGYIKFSMSFSDLVEVLVKKKKLKVSIPFERPFHKNIIKNTIKKYIKNIKYKKCITEEAGLMAAKLQISALK